MTKKNEVPFRNSAGEIYVPPPAGHLDATPQPTEEEAAEFSVAFDEAEKKSSIIDDINWVESQKPKNIDEIIKKHNFLNDLHVKLAKIDDDETEVDTEKADESTEAAKPLPQKPEPVNFFMLNGDFWQVGYEGEKKTVRNLNGMHYIVLLLEKPGKSISCRELYQAVKGKTLDKIMSEGEAIDEGLTIGSSKQAVSDNKARLNYLNRYNELKSDLEKAESNMERQEIKKEMNDIISHLRKRTFADPDTKKAQSNIRKRLKTAYKAIDKAGIKGLAKHLRDYIKPDNAYGLYYSGATTWDITR